MNCPYNYDEPESRLEWFEVRLAELQFEKDDLWVKTQEDEREINDLRDVNKQLRQWKEEALVVLNEWNEVSEYIRMNTDINDLGKSIPELCLKSLKERNQFKEIMKLNFMSDIPTNEKLLTQRTELLAIAEEMAEVIIGNGASKRSKIREAFLNLLIREKKEGLVVKCGLRALDQILHMPECMRTMNETFLTIAGCTIQVRRDFDLDPWKVVYENKVIFA